MPMDTIAFKTLVSISLLCLSLAGEAASADTAFASLVEADWLYEKDGTGDMTEDEALAILCTHDVRIEKPAVIEIEPAWLSEATLEAPATLP